MRLLVTGGAGFIGANFVHSAVHEYPEGSVTVLDALTYASSRESLEPVAGDIRRTLQQLQVSLKDVDKLVANVNDQVAPAVTETLNEVKRTMKSANEALAPEITARPEPKFAPELRINPEPKFSPVSEPQTAVPSVDTAVRVAAGDGHSPKKRSACRAHASRRRCFRCCVCLRSSAGCSRRTKKSLGRTVS